MSFARSHTPAARLLRCISLLVPRSGRRSWLQEWEAELWQVENTGEAKPDNHPTALRLSLGALPHSLWERKEWTMSVLLQDVRFAGRVLRRSPGFTTLAAITMALGIGANTTIFSMTNATLLRAPDGVFDPAAVIQIGRDRPDEGFDNLAYPYYRDFRDGAEGLQSVAAYSARSVVVGRGDEAEVAVAQVVTGEYFDLLGVGASRGRVLTVTDDATPGAHPVVVISDAFWNRRFGNSEDAVGAELVVNGAAYRIIGVAASGFRGTDVVNAPTDVWLPMMMAGEALGERFARFDERGMSWLWMLGRLTPTASPPAVQGELDAIYRNAYQEAWGETPDHPIGVIAGVGLRPDERTSVARLMTTLSLVVAIVLAVTCANLANLLLARGIARAPELGVRTALGAGRVRLVRQLLTESVLLALMGGALAGLLTIWSARVLPALLPLRLGVSFRPDLRVLGFAVAISVLAGMIFGIVPALRASRRDIVETLKEGSPLAGRRAGWLRGGLVVAQLALSFGLLATTGLLVQSLQRARSADPGFNTRDVMTLSFDVNMSGYDEDRGLLLYRQLRGRAAALPGVESAALSSNLPFAGWSRRSVFWPEPRPEAEQPFVQIDWSKVTPGYFETIELPILAGTGFEELGDTADAAGVVILSESDSRLLFGDDEALDRLLPTSPERLPEESLRVVGIVADARVRSLRETPRPSAYVPVGQDYSGRMTLYARTSGDPTALARPLRGALSDLDPEIGVLQIGSSHERMGSSLRDTTTVARLAAIFGLLAVALAGVGLYGVIAYVASSRSHEVGVRMALGAQTGDVLRLFFRQAAMLAITGVVIGGGLTLAAGGVIASLLFGVSPRDPLTFVSIAAGVLALCLVATALPARRAARIDPVKALRQE